MFLARSSSMTLFEPRITEEEASRRFRCWSKSVMRTHSLADLTFPHDHQDVPCLASGGGVRAPAPQGPAPMPAGPEAMGGEGGGGDGQPAAQG